MFVYIIMILWFYRIYETTNGPEAFKKTSTFSFTNFHYVILTTTTLSIVFVCCIRKILHWKWNIRFYGKRGKVRKWHTNPFNYKLCCKKKPIQFVTNQFNDIVLTSAKTSSFCPCLYPLDSPHYFSSPSILGGFYIINLYHLLSMS
jgi:hypothetical protein